MPKERGVSPLPLFWEIFRRLTSKQKENGVDFIGCLWYYLITVRETKSHRNERGK